MPWQWEKFIAPLFGWMRNDGTRRYRQFYVEIPKKNGKSTLLSGLELYLLMGDGEAAAEIYTAAGTREQASIIHNEAEAMAQASDSLASRLMCTTSRKVIAYPRTGGFIKAMSADAPTKEGLHAHAAIFDELHAQPNAKLWDVMQYAGASREQPLLGAITTAGWDRHSICWEQRQIAMRVLDGTYPHWDFLALIYAAAPEDDWTDPAVWRRVNPSLGMTIKEEDLATACSEAQESPRKENSFKRYRLNIWTEQATRWLSMEAWDACAGEPIDAESLRNRRCFAGMDLSSTTDISGVVLAFPPVVDGEPAILLPTFWLPGESALKREQQDKVPYPLWIREGLIEATQGDVIDYGFIRKRLNELKVLYDIQELAFDPWNAQHLATELEEEDGFKMVQFRQGLISMNEPCKQFERMVLRGELTHGGNAVLRWMAGNVAVRTDASDNIRPDKEHSTERIDGIVAAIMALALARTKVQPQNVYATRGFLSLG